MRSVQLLHGLGQQAGHEGLDIVDGRVEVFAWASDSAPDKLDDLQLQGFDLLAAVGRSCVLQELPGACRRRYA